MPRNVLTDAVLAAVVDARHRQHGQLAAGGHGAHRAAVQPTVDAVDGPAPAWMAVLSEVELTALRDLINRLKAQAF